MYSGDDRTSASTSNVVAAKPFPHAFADTLVAIATPALEIFSSPAATTPTLHVALLLFCTSPVSTIVVELASQESDAARASMIDCKIFERVKLELPTR